MAGLYPIWPPSTLALPVPTYVPPDRSKKSHARKQPKGHIPRPRNAFILFRCDFVRQHKVPEHIVNDHQNISRIVGKIWRGLTNDQKTPWIEMAEEEKIQHLFKYPHSRPGPKPTPVTKRRKRRRLSYADQSTKPEVPNNIEGNSDTDTCSPDANITSATTNIQHDIQVDVVDSPRSTNIAEECPSCLNPESASNECRLDSCRASPERDLMEGLWNEWCQYPYTDDQGFEPQDISTTSMLPYSLCVPDISYLSELDLIYRLQDGTQPLDVFSYLSPILHVIDTSVKDSNSNNAFINENILDKSLRVTSSDGLTPGEAMNKVLEYPLQAAQDAQNWEVFLKATQIEYHSDESGIYVDPSHIHLQGN